MDETATPLTIEQLEQRLEELYAEEARQFERWRLTTVERAVVQEQILKLKVKS
jgi:hypothetical protein